MGPFELIAAVAGTVFGSQVLSSLVQGWFTRKKTSAEADAVLSEKAIMYNGQLVERIQKLENDIKDLRREYEEKLEKQRKEYEEKFEKQRLENLSLHKEMAAVQKELEISKRVPTNPA